MNSFFILFSIYLLCNFFLVSECAINIGLSIDKRSLKDSLILIHSIYLTAKDPASIKLHIIFPIAGNRDLFQLKKMFDSAVKSFYNGSIDQIRSVEYDIRKNEPFFLALSKNKKKVHWNSATGADLFRFFIPKIFDDLDRILYLDNDAIVSCCLEEIYNSELPPGKVVGIVKDKSGDLSKFQLKHHYNVSHPMILDSFERKLHRRGFNFSSTDINDLLPSYPNDGVLLFDVKEYNRFGIFEYVEKLALEFSRTKFIFTLGGQQFTVLSMHDKWADLDQRANMRINPPHSRNFLSKNNYNGIIHFAGFKKPSGFCYKASEYFPKIYSTTPWMINNYLIYRRFPNLTYAYYSQCIFTVKYLDNISTKSEFSAIWNPLIAKWNNLDYNYLHLGPIYPMETGIGASKYNLLGGEDLIDYIQKMIINNSSFEFRNYIYPNKYLSFSMNYLENFIKKNPYKKNPGRKKKLLSRSSILESYFPCNDNRAKSILMPNLTQVPACSDLLYIFSNGHRRPWILFGITIDLFPPGIVYKLGEQKLQMKYEPKSSINILNEINFNFFKPKFIALRIPINLYGKPNVKEKDLVLSKLRKLNYLASIIERDFCFAFPQSETSRQSDNSINYTCIVAFYSSYLEMRTNYDPNYIFLV